MSARVRTVVTAAVALALWGWSGLGRAADPPDFLPPIPPVPPLVGPQAPPPAPLPLPPPAPGVRVEEVPRGTATTSVLPAPTDPATAECCPQPTRCGPSDRFWFSAEYIGYTFRPAPIATPLAVARDPAGTRIVLGETDVKLGWSSGLALVGGAWLDERHTVGVRVGAFSTGRQAAETAVVGGPDQTLTRPFIDALTGESAQFFVSSPGFLAGSFRASSTARLAGADARLVWNRVHTPDRTVDLFAGVRYLDLDETLTLTQATRGVGSGVVLLNGVTYGGDTVLTVTDRFRTRNQFIGGEVGGRVEWRSGPGFAALAPSVGFGPVRQSVYAAGSSSVPGVELPGGLYAVTGGNAGRDTTTRFAVMTDLRAEVGVFLTGSCRVVVGYEFLYLGSVARPGDQIDQVVNTRLVPATRRFGSVSGVASPLPTLERTDFYTQALTAGFEIRY